MDGIKRTGENSRTLRETVETSDHFGSNTSIKFLVEFTDEKSRLGKDLRGRIVQFTQQESKHEDDI